MNTTTPKKYHHRLYLFMDNMTKYLVMALILGGGWFSYDHFIGGGKLKNLNAIKSKLHSYSEIEVIKVGSKDDPIVLTNIFASFQTSPGNILTLSGLSSNTFEQLSGEALLRIGSWGIATLKIFPKQEDNPIVYKQGFRITRDSAFLDFLKNEKLEKLLKFDDLISKYYLLEDYVNSLPELKAEEISESFFKKYGKQLENDWGFAGYHHSIRWRFKTEYLGNGENNFMNQAQSTPKISQNILSQLFKDH